MCMVVSGEEETETEKKDSKIGYVTSTNGLKLRKKPSIDAEVIDILSYGHELKIIKRNKGEDRKWLKVKDKVNGVKGYVHGDYVSDMDPHDSMEYLGEWHITAYAYTGNPCANGNMPTAGYTIACNSLDFGTEVYIDGVGVRTVEDRGPGWLGGAWIDLYLGAYGDCLSCGSQYRKVWLIKENDS